MQIRPTAFTIGLIIHPSIALFCVYTEFGVDSDYVILPVYNFDAYFGSTSFSHKWLNLFPDTLLERDKQSFGVCRVKLLFRI